MFSLLQCIICLKHILIYTVKQVCNSQLNEVVENCSNLYNNPYWELNYSLTTVSWCFIFVAVLLCVCVCVSLHMRACVCVLKWNTVSIVWITNAGMCILYIGKTVNIALMWYIWLRFILCGCNWDSLFEILCVCVCVPAQWCGIHVSLSAKLTLWK